jgi:2-haloacid dehalogenase
MLLRRREFLQLAAGGVVASTLLSPLGAQAATQPQFKAIAFDAFPIFDPRPVFGLAETLFPGKGTDLSNAWRTRQFEYQREEIIFAAFAGWDAAGAKWFGYPTFWVNRLNLPAEELGVAPEAMGRDLTALVSFIKGLR